MAAINDVILLLHVIIYSQENWTGKLVFIKYFKDGNIIYVRSVLYVLSAAIVKNHLLIGFC